LIELGVAHDLVEKSGAWYSYQGQRIGQGKDNVREFLKANPTIRAELDKALREKLTASNVAMNTRHQQAVVEDEDMVEA